MSGIQQKITKNQEITLKKDNRNSTTDDPDIMSYQT